MHPKWGNCPHHGEYWNGYCEGCLSEARHKKRGCWRTPIIEKIENQEKAIKEFTKNNPYYTVKKGKV